MKSYKWYGFEHIYDVDNIVGEIKEYLVKGGFIASSLKIEELRCSWLEYSELKGYCGYLPITNENLLGYFQWLKSEDI